MNNSLQLLDPLTWWFFLRVSAVQEIMKVGQSEVLQFTSARFRVSLPYLD